MLRAYCPNIHVVFWMQPRTLAICIKFTKKTDNYENKVLTTVYYVRTGIFFSNQTKGVGGKNLATIKSYDLG